MRFLSLVPIIVLPLVIAACQPPAGRGVDVSLDSQTTETILENVTAEDNSITAAVDAVINAKEQADASDAAAADASSDLTVAARTNIPDASVPEPSVPEASVPEPASPPQPAAPEPAPPPPNTNPDDLIGLSITGLIRRIGEPDFIRIDAGVEIYQYRLASCVIDFVAMPKNGAVSEGDQTPLITSTHRRHRVMNKAYDDQACRLDLGARDQSL